MVRLYTCDACRDDDHKNCDLSHPAPPGHYGGSRCMCPCHGNPNFNDPKVIHKDLMEQLKKLSDFEVSSKRFLEIQAKKQKRIKRKKK